MIDKGGELESHNIFDSSQKPSSSLQPGNLIAFYSRLRYPEINLRSKNRQLLIPKDAQFQEVKQRGQHQ